MTYEATVALYFDYITVDSAARRVYLSHGTEFALADGKGAVFVNIEDKNEVVAIDSSTLKIKSR